MLFAVVLVLAQALAIQANIVPNVDALCKGKSVELTTFAQLKELAAAAPTSNCPAYLKGAIAELTTMIEQGKDNLCSVEAVDSLRAYYTRHMDKATIKEEHEKTLPRSLRKFAIAYGLQMSNLCKKQMVKVLSEDARNLLDAEDFKQIDELTSEDGDLAQMLETIIEPDEVFLPGDLAPVLSKSGAAEKLYMQTATASWVKNLQSVCQHRFKPIYEPLMIPLVRLSNLGFNYKDAPLKCSLGCPATAKHVGQWSRIVFLCESLLGVHIVDDPDNKALTEGTQKTAVKIITKEEAAAIEGASFGADSDSEVAHYEYKPQEQIKLGEVVLDKSNERFTKAVDAFKAGKSEAELAKKAMMKKSKALLKNNLKRGNVGVIVSATYRAISSKDSNSAGSIIVKALDEVVANAGSEGAVAMRTSHILSAIAMAIIVIVLLAAIGTIIAGIVILIMHFAG